jgi:hypothetical protein
LRLVGLARAWSVRAFELDRESPTVTIDFKGNHFPKSVILYAVFFYVRYGVSYRDLEEIMAEREVEIDHATLNRWVVKYSPLIAANAQARKRSTAVSWRMDETYIKFVERGPTCIARLIVTGKPLILCCQNAAILLPLGGSSNVPLVPMAFKQFADLAA